LPAPITTRLNGEITRILKSDDVQRILGENGLETIPNSPAEFAAMIEKDAKIWDDAAAIAGLVSR
jgi:tripartite-type tricarboxylate transporter receptor subunit TctC